MAHSYSIILFIVISFLITSCGEKQGSEVHQATSALTNVPIATARIMDQPVLHEILGTVQAGISANLSSKAMGSIKDIYVREGARVKKGDTLALIDQAQARAGLALAEERLAEARKALAAARSSKDAARAQKELSLATYDRYLELKKRASVGIQEFDEVDARRRQAEAVLDQAEASVEAAEARTKQAEAGHLSSRITLEDTLIIAPYDGLVTARLMDKGDLASPGTPILRMETTEGYRVDAIVSEAYIQHVRQGQKVPVHIPAIEPRGLEGTVAIIVPAADERAHSFLIKVELPPDPGVRSGMFARIQIPAGRSPQILVPDKALVSRGQLMGLFLVDADNIARFRLIRTGRAFGEMVEVLSGLRDGDRYVKEPPPTIVDGSRLEAVP